MEDWGIVEDATRAEVGHAGAEAAVVRSRNSAVAGRDVMGVAGTDSEEGLLVMVGHCGHGDPVDAGPGRCMGGAEGHWTRGREEARCQELIEVVDGRATVSGFDLGFLQPVNSRSSARPASC